MTLERFRRKKMIALNHRSMAYQAARAMEDNHVGAVLVTSSQGLAGIVTDRDLALAILGGDLDPNITTLGEIMSEGVVTCDVNTPVQEAARLMAESRVRRIPVTENGCLAGLITFDDLVLDSAVSIEMLRSIVTAQLEVEAPQKPAGALYPQGPVDEDQRAAGRSRALMRSKARSEMVYDRFVAKVASASGLEYERAEKAMLISLCMLCRRLAPEEAQHTIAQLPSRLQPQLEQCLDGPERLVTTEAIRDELSRALGLNADAAAHAMQSVFQTTAESVSRGQIEEVRGQLPEGMKDLFPSLAA
jgi:uncharacterized protein (DUF2267 family)